MDGDNRRLKQHHHHHGPSGYSSRSGIGRRPVPRPAGSAHDRFRHSAHAQALQPNLAPATGGQSRMPTYAHYGYADPSSFQGDSLQPDELQPYSSTADFSCQPQQQHQQQQELRGHERQQHHQHRHHQIPHPQSFAPYEPDMDYHLNQPAGHTQTPYEVVAQYPAPVAGVGARQSAAIEALSAQFAVPQYFPPTEPAGTGFISPYLTPHQLPPAFNQPGHIGRSRAPQSFPGTMADFTPVASTTRLEQQQQQSSVQPQTQTQQQPASSESLNVGEAYAQFQQALRVTFDHVRAGRLAEASRSLLEISEWLVSNARELGILRDDEALYSDRLKLWNDFNICWLAVCQKQKDMTHDLLQLGQSPPNTSLLAPEAMEDLARGLIQLCDKMESHGLVDYQMGIWEEEILCILTQCLDLMERRQDMLQGHNVAAVAAAAAAASVSRS